MESYSTEAEDEQADGRVLMPLDQGELPDLTDDLGTEGYIADDAFSEVIAPPDDGMPADAPDTLSGGTIVDHTELEGVYEQTKAAFYGRENRRGTTFIRGMAVGESIVSPGRERSVGLTDISGGASALAVVSTLADGTRRAYLQTLPSAAAAGGKGAADSGKIMAAMTTKGTKTAEAVIMTPGSTAENDYGQPADPARIAAIAEAVRLALGETVRVAVVPYSADVHDEAAAFTGQGTVIVRMQADGTHHFEVGGEPFDMTGQG